MSKLVCGVGMNDLKGQVKRLKDGGSIYQRWNGMLNRCYGSQRHARYPSYIGCSVADEWLTFSNFYTWMSEQQWVGRHLDKDLLMPGNKVYAPDRCVLLDPLVNGFLLESTAVRGSYPLGVSWIPGRREFMVKCSNPVTLKQETLGYVKDAASGYALWRARKHHHACILADMQTDQRVADALRSRYAEVSA